MPGGCFVQEAMFVMAIMAPAHAARLLQSCVASSRGLGVTRQLTAVVADTSVEAVEIGTRQVSYLQGLHTLQHSVAFEQILRKVADEALGVRCMTKQDAGWESPWV